MGLTLKVRATAAALQAVALLGERGRGKSRRMSGDPKITAMSKGHVLRARRRGLRWELDLGDNLQRTLFFTGWYEHEFLMFLEQELRPGDTYLDIGGHIGLDALLGAKRVGAAGRVVVFEPSPDSAEKLRRGAARNGLGNIEVHQVAVGSKRGSFEMRVDPEWGARDAGVRSKYNEGEVLFTVQVVALDDYLTLDRADVVKLDIEGAELEAIRGMRGMLQRLQPRTVVVEVTPRRLERLGQTEQELEELLGEAGYRRDGQPLLENVVFRRA